ncbi:putative membrane protein [Synechococcus sp. BIOS-U3-1]|nr:putative membrane protein [Synechococcus sp. BIOS-U3-1]
MIDHCCRQRKFNAAVGGFAMMSVVEIYISIPLSILSFCAAAR